MYVELLIPGYLVLIAAFIGGGIVCGLLFISAAKAFFRINNARHSYMAHSLSEIRSRNKDYDAVKADQYERGWAYRVVGFFLSKHRRGN